MDIFGNDDIHRIPNASPNILNLGVRIVIPHDVVKGETFPYQFQDIQYWDASSSHTRFPEMDVWINGNSFFHDDLSSFTDTQKLS
jgi:hypothetical protein